MILAGFTPTTILGGTDLFTTVPAAIKAPSLILTPGIINELLPIYTKLPIITRPKASKSGICLLTTCPPP